MSNELQEFENTKKLLDKISPSFCAAKWTQVSIHLAQGHTHSCHHPQTHKIPLDELKLDCSALHNTKFKKEQRMKMLSGERPSECQYCWNIEDSSDYYSDRVMKSNCEWSKPFITDIQRNTWYKDYDPKYVEVDFGNLCNFKCAYCSPAFSTTWMEEIEEHGPYPTSFNFNNIDWLKETDRMPIPPSAFNPYIEAWWRWFPQIYIQLLDLQITGGEPLINPNTYKLLDYIIEHPNKNLILSINTNGCPPRKMLNKFIDKLSIISNNNLVKQVKLFTSVDTWGEQAEYLRTGLNYKEWFKNIETILSAIPKIKIGIMCASNALSLTHMKNLVTDIYYLKTKYFNNERKISCTIDFPTLRHPQFLSAKILPPEYASILDDAINYMKDREESKNTDSYKGFFDFEIHKLERFKEFIATPPHPSENFNIEISRKDFKIFIDEYDKRRGYNFKKTFPEYVNFYESIKY